MNECISFCIRKTCLKKNSNRTFIFVYWANIYSFIIICGILDPGSRKRETGYKLCILHVDIVLNIYWQKLRLFHCFLFMYVFCREMEIYKKNGLSYEIHIVCLRIELKCMNNKNIPLSNFRFSLSGRISIFVHTFESITVKKSSFSIMIIYHIFPFQFVCVNSVYTISWSIQKKRKSFPEKSHSYV